MVVQYPYILQVLFLTGSTQDANGNYQEQTETWANYCRCRDEAGAGKKVTTVDGNVHDYSYLIQMPRGVEAIAPGTMVQVMQGSEVRAKGKVIYSRKDQMHSRIWV